MLIRLLLTLAVSRLYPLFPSDFDLSASHRPCRIFNRTAFSQHDCGACAAFAVATAYAMRECIRSDRDTIPSPHRLFNCASGDCVAGSMLGKIVEVLNRDEVGDADSGPAEEFGKPCANRRTPLALPLHLAVFATRWDDERMLKTDLFVYGNPVLAVIEPDEEMSLYSRTLWSARPSLQIGDSVQFEDGNWVQVNAYNSLDPNSPLPVYHITGQTLHPHAVVIMGWGTTPEPYWIVQNSWGSDWGENGRGRIAMRDIDAAFILDFRLWADAWIMMALSILVLAFALAAELMMCCCGLMGRNVKEKMDDQGVCV